MIKAPYNFVPLAEQVVFPEWADKISIDIPFEDGISGTIDVSYTAQTPVFIGNGKTGVHVENYKAANGQYALPGSSLRGMIRNVIEIASFGKFSLINDLTLSFRDLHNRDQYNKRFAPNGKNIVRAGWLSNESGGWVLYPVSYHRVEDELLEKIYNPDVSYKKRQEPAERVKTLKSNPVIYFEAEQKRNVGSKATTVRKNNFHNAIKGYTVLTGQPGSGKHMDFIFEQKSDRKILVTEKIIQAFEDSNDPNAANQQAGIFLNSELKNYKESNYPGIPVFYLPDTNGKPESLGLSQMYRLPYKYTLGEAVLHSSRLHGEENKMDFAECIFGRIEKKDKVDYSLRGRVQFEDAVGQNVSLDSVVTTILSNPKPSFYPNYIEQNASNSNFITLMDDNVRLRGWKRYPVRNSPNPIFPNMDQEKQKTEFKPMKKGSSFEGKIHFHNLKPQELGALLWSITWNNNKDFSHSIGMGKPYGFGQIKAEIISLSFLGNSNLSNNYEEANSDNISLWQNEFSKYMEDKIKGWKSTSQLKELYAMANPENANRRNWTLVHLSMARKEFVTVTNRGSREYLASYSQENQCVPLAPEINNTRNGGFSNNRNVRTVPFQPKSEGGVVNGKTYTCILLDEKTKKGGWKAKVKNNEGISGSITNSQAVPTDKKPGDEITLKIRSLSGTNTSFDFVQS